MVYLAATALHMTYNKRQNQQPMGSSRMTSQSFSKESESRNNRAIILAGGQGTRLKPYTTLFPKALVPLDEMPVLELVIRQLKSYGFTEITMAVGHLCELIEAYFGDGRKWGVSIMYAREDKPLGTAGPLKAMTDLPENFLVMNADIVSDINYRELFDFHCRPQADGAPNLATIAVYRRTSKIDFGVLEFDADTHRIQNFIEKPMLEHSVSMGIYVFNRQVRDFIPEDTFFGFDSLVKTLIRDQGAIQAFPFNGYWLDIGRVDDYETAVTDFQNMRNVLLPAEAAKPEVLKP
ncbi:MAG: Mannose-phosphate guanyltransferase [Vampirovibrio sp.]|jgi:NDP-sugar pyrophosphorylase family protein|nr:Mannose-phosphate guanyltransferase [Vampirovibrio sp.]